jgi:hypothetical protein
MTSIQTGKTIFKESSLRKKPNTQFLPPEEPCHGKKTVEDDYYNGQPGKVDMPRKPYVAFSFHDHRPKNRGADKAEEQDGSGNHDHGKRNPS